MPFDAEYDLHRGPNRREIRFGELHENRGKPHILSTERGGEPRLCFALGDKISRVLSLYKLKDIYARPFVSF